MKGLSDRTKVVLRHLPPAISQATLMDQIDAAFAGRYHWVAFRPGKSSMKHQFYTRAYIDFKKPEDVIEFAEFFDGHLFVSEKGTQFKTIVEYAPSQRVPKQWSKKDGREGTILKDPEYLEFLEYLAKPVENLPSAEIQLERREAERGGAAKDALVVTPLMDFVRQKRAAKGGSRVCGRILEMDVRYLLVLLASQLKRDPGSYSGMILGAVILPSRLFFLLFSGWILIRRHQVQIFWTALVDTHSGMFVFLELPMIGKLELFPNFSFCCML